MDTLRTFYFYDGHNMKRTQSACDSHCDHRQGKVIRYVEGTLENGIPDSVEISTKCPHDLEVECRIQIKKVFFN